VSQDWRPGARAWLRDTFPDSRRFEVQVHRERAWGDLWRVGVDEGDFWFKRAAQDLATEVALVRLLARTAPDDVLIPHATHAEQRWILTRDQGPTLASRSREEGPHHYVETSVALARVQQAVGRHHDDLLAVGLHDFAPVDFVERIDDHLSWCAALPAGHPLRLGDSERRRTIRRAERLLDQWLALGSHGPGVGLDHNDLHLGNAFPGPILNDWGDAVRGHPFASLRALVVPCRKAFGRAAARGVRRAYLACWGDPDELAPVLETAMRMAAAQRFLAWRRLGDLDALAEYHQWVTPLLARLGESVDDVDVP